MIITNNWKTKELVFDFTKTKTMPSSNKCKICNTDGKNRYRYGGKGWGYYCLTCKPLPVSSDCNNSLPNFKELKEEIWR